MSRYLVIIARDRPELLGTLAVIYGQKGEVEIHFDRRQGPPGTGTGADPTAASHLTGIRSSRRRVFW